MSKVSIEIQNETTTVHYLKKNCQSKSYIKKPGENLNFIKLYKTFWPLAAALSVRVDCKSNLIDKSII